MLTVLIRSPVPRIPQVRLVRHSMALRWREKHGLVDLGDKKDPKESCDCFHDIFWSLWCFVFRLLLPPSGCKRLSNGFRNPKTSWKPFCLSRIAFYLASKTFKHIIWVFPCVSPKKGPSKSPKTSGFPFKHDILKQQPSASGEGSADSKVGGQRVGQRRWHRIVPGVSVTPW